MKAIYRGLMLAGGAAALVTVGAAHASTVVIDFEGGHHDPGFFGNALGAPGDSYLQNDPNNGNYYNTVGTWRENGFQVDWRGYTYDLPEPIPEDYNSFKWLQNESGVIFADTGTSMTLSRPDGKSFSLLGMESDGGYQSEFAVGSFTPEAGSGYEEVSYFQRPALGGVLRLTGTLSSGETVTGSGRSVSEESWTGYEWAFGPAEIAFSSSTLSAFTDLTSLTLYADLPDFLNLAAIKSFIDFGAPDVLLKGLDEGCRFNDPVCAVPGLGTFSYYTYGSGDTQSVDILRMSFDVSAHPAAGPHLTHDSHPAPVPLPASALLLLGGVAAVAALRLKRRSITGRG